MPEMQPAPVQQPTDAQKIEALSNEVAILMETIRRQGDGITKGNIELTRWQMTSNAQIKLIADLRAAADPKAAANIAIMKARIAELEEALGPASEIGKPAPLADATPPSPVPAGAGMLNG